MKKRNRILCVILLAVAVCALLAVSVFAAGEDSEGPGMYGTAWAIVPPLVAIALALITKEVYSSLFIGILVGCYSSVCISGPMWNLLHNLSRKRGKGGSVKGAAEA